MMTFQDAVLEPMVLGAYLLLLCTVLIVWCLGNGSDEDDRGDGPL